MKKVLALTGYTLLALLIAAGAFAQEEETSLPVEAAADDGKRLYLLFSEGTACSWLTRIIKQTGRSNFVFEDFFPGLYFRMDLHTTKNIMPMVRIAALYPLVSTFNKFPQKPKTPLHFGADMNLGVNFNILEFDLFRLNAGPALHLFFLNSERWNYFNMGAAAFVGMELPLTEGWTIICNGLASLDNGNLGANRVMEPFDIAYQYQVDVGVRYSKIQRNKTSLFPGNQSAMEGPFLSR
jgi:hypothetical protein